MKLPFQAPLTQIGIFGALNTKVEKIGRVVNIYFNENSREIW